MNISVTHIGIYTQDLERLKNFYVKYFEAKCNDKYENKAGFSSYFLTLGSNVRIEIMSHKLLEYRKPKEKINGISHIALSVGTKENVIELTNCIVNDGYKLNSPPRLTGDGYFESNICDPDGNIIEITE